MKHETGTLQTPDGYTLFTQSWLPDTPRRATLIIAHGYAEHSGRYAHLGEFFSSKGYAVYALDHRGHGQSRGKHLGYFESFATLSSDLGLFVERTRAQLDHTTGNKIFLLGHSMGALLSLYYVIREAPRLNGMIVSGSAITIGEGTPKSQERIGRFISRWMPTMKLVPFAGSAISRDPAVVAAYNSDPNVYTGNVRARVAIEMADAATYVRANLDKIGIPLLIVHGSADTIAPVSNTKLITQTVTIPDKTTKIYDGLYHEIFNEPEKETVMNDVLMWLTTHRSTGELRRQIGQ